MTINNVELSDIIPFKEDKYWYLRLIYKYEEGRIRNDFGTDKNMR